MVGFDHGILVARRRGNQLVHFNIRRIVDSGSHAEMLVDRQVKVASDGADLISHCSYSK